MIRARGAVLAGFALMFSLGIYYFAVGTPDTTFDVPNVSLSEASVTVAVSTPVRVAAKAQSESPTSTQPVITAPLFEPDLPPCAARYFEANYVASAVPDAERSAAVVPIARIDQVYMIHYTPMKKRRAAMSAMLALHNVSVHWVLGFDKEVLNESTAECFHSWKASDHSGVKSKRHDLRKWIPLGKSQRSVVVKHHSALYDAYRRGYENVLVLEDDAFLRVRFQERLAEVMALVPRTYDVIMIGGCMNMHAWRRKFGAEMLSKHLYRKREARCAHAFVASQKGVRHLLSSLPLTQAIDFQMTSAMVERSMEVYWVEPYLSVQGPSPECVTSIDLGAPCVSVEKRIGKEYDPRFATDTDANNDWEYVPAFHSKR